MTAAPADVGQARSSVRPSPSRDHCVASTKTDYAAGVSEHAEKSPERVAGVAGARTRRRIEQGMPELARLATSRMEATLPWYRALSAQDRSWVGLVAQAGVGAFLAWFRDPAASWRSRPTSSARRRAS